MNLVVVVRCTGAAFSYGIPFLSITIVSVNMQANNSVTSWFINVFNRGNAQKTVVPQNGKRNANLPIPHHQNEN